jgi:hypothetical protein
MLIVRTPHLTNPTIKPRCYSGRGGGLYPWSNIPPTACEPGVACSRFARRSPQQVSAHERRRGNRAAEMRGREGSNPGPRLWYQVRTPHLTNPTIKPRCYSGRGGGLYPWSNTNKCRTTHIVIENIHMQKN